jgi:diadenosine tetraphosphate (Ap4A) HIT family hydrolase
VTARWPVNWGELIRGVGCEMCAAGRPEVTPYGVLIGRGVHTDSYLQRAAIQRGYTVVIWRGRHVTEPTELSDEEASAYWRDVLTTAKALISYYAPMKMNYETLGNSLPHLHTHLVPRYSTGDPNPGRPFPLVPRDGPDKNLPDDMLWSDARQLRSLTGFEGPVAES